MTKFFKPYLDELSIENWHCEKRKGNRFGSLTFLSPLDGEKFLRRHGQSMSVPARGFRPVGRANLMFQGTALICSLSNKKPDPLALRSLEMEAKAKRHAISSNAREDSFPLAYSSVSCGLWEYIGSKLVFVSYLDWQVHGSVKFGSRVGIIKMDTGQSIDIPHLSVDTIVCEGLPRPAMTISLREAPHFFNSIVEPVGLSSLFESLNIGPKSSNTRKRLPALNSEHEKIAGSCLVYRIGLIGSTFDDQVNAIGNARGILPPAVRYHTVIHKHEERYAAAMNSLIQALSKLENKLLPFALKFQVQKLAQNGYLPPQKVLALLPEIANLLERTDLRVCVNTVRALFHQLQFAGPETDAQNFELRALIDLLRENEEREKRKELYIDESAESQNVAIIHRVSVTPAGIYLYGPEKENKNRVLRKYPSHHDYLFEFSSVTKMVVNLDSIQTYPTTSSSMTDSRKC